MNRFHVLLILLVTIATFAFVSVRLDIVKSSYKIHALEKRQKALQDEIGSLHAKINADRSPQKLEPLARKKLNMQPPQAGQVFVLRADP